VIFFLPITGGVAAHAFFRELLLVEGIAQQGLGNWQAVAEHVGTRTKEEVEEHYNTVYIDSSNWPRPVRLF
jgi:transcriptional adapter 2-alpha